jgi:hypothetical protein
MNTKKEKKKKKHTALIICRDRTQFWTTQAQFWQWARAGVIVKMKDSPLTGEFVREHEERLVTVQRMVLNLACPHHLREVLAARRLAMTNR